MFWDADTRMDDEGAPKRQYVQHGAVCPMPRRQLEKPPHAVGPEPVVKTPFWYPAKHSYYSDAAKAPVAQARSKPASLDLWIRHEKSMPLTQPHICPLQRHVSSQCTASTTATQVARAGLTSRFKMSLVACQAARPAR